jgi:hypothetical protein
MRADFQHIRERPAWSGEPRLLPPWLERFGLATRKEELVM